MNICRNNYQIMLQYLCEEEKQKQSYFKETIEQKVKFIDHSESGYSTTSSDDALIYTKAPLHVDMSSELLKQRLLKHAVQVYPREATKQPSQNFTHIYDEDMASSNDYSCTIGNSQENRSYQSQQSTYQKQYNEADFNRNITSLSHTSSASPASLISNHVSDPEAYYYVGDRFDYQRENYYDPLHLSNISQSDVSELKQRHKSRNHLQLDVDRNVYRSSQKRRGILKKGKYTKSMENISSSSFCPEMNGIQKDTTTAAQYQPQNPLLVHCNNPINYQQDESYLNQPLRVPAMYPSDSYSTPSPYSSADSHRKSAFTPVCKQRAGSSSDLSDVGSHAFTPVKGPAVLEYVTSKEKLNELDTKPFSAEQFLQPQYNPKDKYAFLQSQQTSSGFAGHYNHKNQSENLPYTMEGNLIRGNQVLLPQEPVPAPRHKIGDLSNNLNSLQVNQQAKTSKHMVGATDTTSQKRQVSKVEVLINDAVRLQHFVENTSSKDIKRLLTDKLHSKDPKIIEALSLLFPIKIAKQLMAHCVRCHRDYNPNERSRCYLPHPERKVFKVNQDEEGADFVCQCCSTGFRLLKMDFYEETTNALLTGHCYSGQHTTDPESVDYRKEDGAAKSCEENGCVEFYV